MEFNHKTMRKIMQLITFTVLLLVGLLNINVVMDTIGWFFGILMPFIIGCCIAFIISVPMKQFEEKVFRKGKSDNKVLAKIRRPLSILLSLIAIIGLVLIVILLISPELSATISKLVNETIPDFFDNVQKWATDLTNKYPEISKYLDEYEFDWDKISSNVLNLTQFLANGVFNSTFSILGVIVSTITNFVIGLVFAIYLLSNKEKLAIQGKKIMYSYLPIKRADRILSILKLTHNSFSNFLSGQCVEAVIEGCLFFLVLSIFKFNYSLLIGVIAAFMALIPIFGAFIACGIGFLLLFMVNPIQALWFIVIFLIIQQVESNLIYPYVVGGSIGLPSIWVLFAVTIGGSLMGVVGMLIFIPLFSVFYILLRETVRVRLMVRRVPNEKYNEVFAMSMEQQREELESRGRKREMRRQQERGDIGMWDVQSQEAKEREPKKEHGNPKENLKNSGTSKKSEHSSKPMNRGTQRSNSNLKNPNAEQSKEKDSNENGTTSQQKKQNSTKKNDSKEVTSDKKSSKSSTATFERIPKDGE